MTIGVYALINKAENKIYIGSSSNVERRIIYHRSHIKCGHKSMISSLRGKNVDDFDFQIIAKVETIDEARSFETLLLKAAWGSDWLYNLAPHANGASGAKRNPEKYIVGSKKRLSNPNFAKKHSEACKGKRQIVVCPHCNKSGGGGNMRRYHFDKCKLK